ncbi:hypothetical protein P7D85_19320 [Enterococcus hulanensis]|uniref:Uncharacterized protein n=1 Tax=Enterococcus hulanensis TaxID=2559929 RepID=A0ABU3F6Y7_9ENTE|nr:hypothetical protein [Enterococcus hulanensis]MDT2601936.1 hypothetical protein [Enterococcus hulanensis]MDT2611433.1 hypothetical protein [Enterococcus hulanensis]MDT2618651.1 hypothetical protein [Enterococcus hulanensis]MDT2630008.1 hypothetical protein [Enterococcus hulanensis]MDT2657715.1 hypothetical protein [Enterococcus hulanensis]
MKRNKVILTLLFLCLLTFTSYSLAKYTDKKIYVISVTDSKFNSMPPPSGARKSELTKPKEPVEKETITTESSEKQIEEAESQTEQMEPQPEIIFEANYDGKTHELPLEKEGIYAIQLYSGESLGTDVTELADMPSYAAVYLENPAELQVQLGDAGTIKDQNEETVDKDADEQDSDLEKAKLGESSTITKIGETAPILKTSEEKVELNADMVTKISPNSQLHTLLQPYQGKAERNYTGKIVVTYLGPSEVLDKVKELNKQE